MPAEQEHEQVIEVAFLLDADICGDALSQVEILAKRLGHSGDLRTRVVLFGRARPGSVLVRFLARIKQTSGPGPMFELPRPRGLAPLDVLSLVRSQALSGCNLVHCFSMSLVDVLGSLPGRALLAGWCLSLSHWPGEETVGHLVQACRRSPAGIICLSQSLRESLIHNGIPAELCRVIPPVLEDEAQPVSRQEAREQLNIAEDVPLLLAGPEISCCSNHFQLTWATAIIGQVLPRVRVLVPGCSAGIKRLRAYDDSLAPPSLGMYVGEKFDPQLLYKASDVLVLPAEGPVSPMPILRAGRARLPIVASDNQAFREHLRHEHNALLFSPKQYSTGDHIRRRIRPLATAILRLLENRSLARRLAEQLAKDACLGFPLPEFLKAHRDLYRTIAASNDPASAKNK